MTDGEKELGTRRKRGKKKKPLARCKHGAWHHSAHFAIQTICKQSVGLPDLQWALCCHWVSECEVLISFVALRPLGSGWVSVWLNINPWEDEGVCLPPSPVIRLLFGSSISAAASHTWGVEALTSWLLGVIAALRLDIMHGIICEAWFKNINSL